MKREELEKCLGKKVKISLLTEKCVKENFIKRGKHNFRMILACTFLRSDIFASVRNRVCLEVHM